MSKPIASSAFVDLLEEWDIPFTFITKIWATHNRNHKGEFSDVKGVMLHHTGTDVAVKSQANILTDGYAGLPGPLCHGGIAPDGKLHIAGWGRANHAGLGDSAILAKVISENYTGNLKPTDQNGFVDGNSRFYGFEIMYSGSRKMTGEQEETAAKISAALCRKHGWNSKSVIGHGEWQPGKWDPGYRPGKIIDMAAMRVEIQDWIRLGPPPKKPVPPAAKMYRIKDNDTLYAIAKSQLGDAKRWPEIVSLNSKLINLDPGTQITLPKK